jgi:hypothetical protein
MAPRTDQRRKSRLVQGAAIGVLAIGTLLVVGPASGSPTAATPQPAPGAHAPTKADPPATHQPAPGSHVSTLTPGARVVTKQPVG